MNFHMTIENVDVYANEEISKELASKYLEYVKSKNPGRAVQSMNLTFEGEEVGLGYNLRPVQFEKIRRITGYLVGDMSRWNNGKTAEESDRVKHA